MTQEKDSDGFLSRWSQRKLSPSEQDDAAQTDNEPVQTAEQPVVTSEAEPESVADELKPVWQREDVDADTKKLALRALFQKPEFHVRDGLNEYDDDFTKFSSLGNIVTHEMKRMLKLAEEKTRPDAAAESKPTDSAQSESAQPEADKEDKDLA
jgi:hypothetical protein